MGMYTELLIKTSVKEEMPEQVENVLKWMFDNKTATPPKDLPNHPFFQKERWTMIGSCSSFYHIPWAVSRYAKRYLFSRSDLKNYEKEIEAFLDWFMPYVDEPSGRCIGWTWYEEADKPTLIIVPE